MDVGSTSPQKTIVIWGHLSRKAGRYFGAIAAPTREDQRRHVIGVIAIAFFLCSHWCCVRNMRKRRDGKPNAEALQPARTRI